MSDKPDGGPAFPDVDAHGMTLRDYFAAKAMEALIIRAGAGDDAAIAEYAFLMADAMLKERNKGAA